MRNDRLGPGGLRELLDAVARGEVDPEEALGHLADWPFALVPGAEGVVARADTLRELRTGLPEVVFGGGKEPSEIVAIVERLYRAHGRVLVTRLSVEAESALREREMPLRVNRRARTATVGEVPAGRGDVLIVAAGTSDLPVAEEAIETSWFCGSTAETLVDVGVAGLHRLLASVPRLRRARVIVAVAGMEGTLPGVIAGLTDRPVIAVPTSVGYGVSAGGQAALRTMLTSCAPGLAVVNIDNGFGAAVLAHRINTMNAV